MFTTGRTARQTRITSGINRDGLRLQIEDESSGTLLAELKLTAEQVWEVLRGGSFTLEGEGAINTERIGKTTELFALESIPDRVRALVKTYDDLSPVTAWARDMYPGYDDYSARRHSGGRIGVSMRRWV